MQPSQQQSKKTAMSLLYRGRKRIIVVLTIIAAAFVIYAFVPVPVEELTGTGIDDKIQVKYTNRFNIWKELYWDEWVGK